MRRIPISRRRGIALVLLGVAATAGTVRAAATSPPTAQASHDTHDEEADCAVQFVEMMIPHHRQAADMGRLADTHARDARVRRLAEAIHVSQDREIAMMTRWLNSTAGAGSAHVTARGPASTMPGMLTTAELRALASARGEAFDTAYLRDMIRHHWGAVLMSEQALQAGVKRPVAAVAGDTVIIQRTEIVEMQRLLRSLETGVEVTPERFAQEMAKKPLVNPLEGSPAPACKASG